MARELGLPAEVLDPAGLAAADPEVTLAAAGGVLYPQDAHLSPEAFLDWLTRDVERLGGEVHRGMELERLETRGNRVTTARFQSGTVDCDEVVMAGGVWSGRLLSTLGVRLPLQPGKGYSLTLENPPQLPRLCSILVEGKVAVTPMGGRLRLAGTMELGQWDESVNPARVRGIRRTARAFLPALEGADLEAPPVWVGHRPCSPDGLPYVGRWPRLANLTIATGHAMMGLSLAPVTGSLVAQAVDGESNPLLDLLRPDRFA
jgi:D-amino-acid dehydrogenase